MIYTCSQFKNELDVLEIRLETLGDLVDVIVIGEATVDQRGRPKPLNFLDNKNRFKKWEDKIRYIPVEDMPTGEGYPSDYARERWQRDVLIRGMWDLQPDDLVYASDLDEIPYPEALAAGLREPQVRFGMDLHVYALNWRWLDRGCRVGTLGSVLTGESILRQGVCGALLWDKSVRQQPGVSGWHLTYQGGVRAIRDKITGMMDKAEDLVYQMEVDLSDEWIWNSIRTGQDVFGRVYRQTEWVGLDQLPPVVRKHPERYAHMLIPKPANQDWIESQPRCSCGAIIKEGVLHHFPYCQLAKLDTTPIHWEDSRIEPRSEGVGA